MIKKNFLFNWMVMVGSLIVCLLATTSLALAQQTEEKKQSFGFFLAKPAVFKPKDVKPTSFVASWRNVPEPEGDVRTLSYRLHVTHEFEAKQDGVYPVANAVIKGAPQETDLLAGGGMTWLDDYISQKAWWGAYLKALPNAIRLDAASLPDHIPDEFIETLARVASPVYDLQNNGGKFTFKFKAKVASGSTAAQLSVYGYGEERSPAPVQDVRTITVPADGQVHEFSLNFTDGTWCHTMLILPKNRVSVDFVDAFKIEQELKKGDKGFRSVMRGAFPNNEAITADVVTPGNPLATIYSREIGDLNPEILNVELAQQNGERVAYRILCEYVFEHVKTFISRSLYSEPVYFDNIPSEENKYLYVGYADYEEPDMNFAYPGSVPEGQEAYVGASIKATEELLGEYVGGKVVGLRFCVAAANQEETGHKYATAPWNPVVPNIFLAEKLRSWDENSDYTEESKTKFIQTKAVEFKDGWNTIFFDEPYSIEKKKEFYAGAFLYDAAAHGKTFITSRVPSEEGKKPEAFMVAYDSQGVGHGDLGFIPFGRAPSHDNAVLMQFVIEPDPTNPKFQNKGTIYDLKTEVLYYDNEPLILTSSIKNDGVKAIQTIGLKVEIGGEVKEHTVVFSEPVPAGASLEFSIKPFEQLSKMGEVDIKLTLTKINDAILETPVTLEAKTKIVDHTKVFPRTIMFETFTSENCPNCPRGETNFMFRFDKPEFKYIKQRTVFVTHHDGSVGGDFLKHSYSSKLFPLYGAQSNSGDVRLRSPYTPAGMFDRTINPYFSIRDGNAPVSSVHLLENEFRKAVNHAVYRNPAYGRLGLKETYDDATKKLTVEIEGEVSDMAPVDRPLYVTIMLVQSAVKSRSQLDIDFMDVGGVNRNYVHHNALRYVDEGGLQGIPVQLDANGKFTISKTIDLVGVEMGGTLVDNQLLLEDEDGSSISMKELVENGLQVIAFLHHYTELPTANDVEVNDSRFGKNEIINVASNRIKPPKSLFPAQEITAISTPEFDATQEIVYVENRTVRVTSAYNRLQVFAIDGTIVRNDNLIDGTYVVRAELTDGRVVTSKVIVR